MQFCPAAEAPVEECCIKLPQDAAQGYPTVVCGILVVAALKNADNDAGGHALWELALAVKDFVEESCHGRRKRLHGGKEEVRFDAENVSCLACLELADARFHFCEGEVGVEAVGVVGW